MPQDYRKLIVWQNAIELTVPVYKLTRPFPKEEIYGLTSQMRRASVSIASNIAEGRGRLNAPEFRQFLGIAQGSKQLAETESLCNEVSRMLNSFIEINESRKAQESTS